MIPVQLCQRKSKLLLLGQVEMLTCDQGGQHMMWICPAGQAALPVPMCKAVQALPARPRLDSELRLGFFTETPCTWGTAPPQGALGEHQVFSSKGSDCPYSHFPFPSLKSLKPAKIRSAASVGKWCLGKGEDRNRCSSNTIRLMS